MIHCSQTRLVFRRERKPPPEPVACDPAEVELSGHQMLHSTDERSGPWTPIQCVFRQERMPYTKWHPHALAGAAEPPWPTLDPIREWLCQNQKQLTCHQEKMP